MNPFSSTEEMLAYLERAKHGWKSVSDIQPEPDEGRESGLQSKCEKWLKKRGYPFFHDKSRGKNKAGWFDLTCLLPEGRVVFIELKSGKGRKSPEQAQLHRMAKYLKHEVWEVRSYKYFLHIMLGED